ncbi:MAG: diguanylate cyclase [Planctomycetes bacterium]|nr:diguanylate cyclase [Planctomycetota bacterium]
MDASMLGQPRVLLIDGDAARAARHCSQLALQGWHVIDVGDPREALRAVRTAVFDLVLIQMAPAAAAGMDLPGGLQRAAGGGFLPVIVIGDGTATEEDRCRCLDSGADEVFPPSIGADELWARMRALLRIKVLQDALDDSKRALEDALRREQQLIEQLRADNDLLLEQVVTDPLTRLYNVRYFHQFIGDEFRIARRYGHPLTLLMLDLDHFKAVNDAHGHPMGDFVLRQTAGIFRRTVRDADVAARTGGEEFAVILPRTGRQAGHESAQRIRTTLAEHTFVSGPTHLQITCSIGLACYRDDADVTSPHHLIYFADQALLAAKQAGRDRIVHWIDLDGDLKARLRTHARSFADADNTVNDEDRTADQEGVANVEGG